HPSPGLPSDVTKKQYSHEPITASADTGVALPRVLDDAGLPQDRDLNLARVLEILLDLLRQVARQAHGAGIVDIAGLHDHAHLSASLNGIGLVDSVERCRQLLERL